MSRSSLPILGITAGALLAIGSLLAFGATGGAPERAAGNSISAPAAQVTPTVALTGTMWEWTTTGMNDGTVITATDPARYTVEFLDGGQMAIRADCNRGSGTYTMNGPELTITPGAFTRIGCPPDSQDQAFLRDLERVGSYLIRDGNLVLELRFDSGGMSFREARLTTQATPTAAAEATPGASGDLTGGVWQWQRTDMGGGSSTTVPNPAMYTIEFLADGTAGIRADCNVGNATYVLSGANGIEITLGVSTLVACPPGSLDTTFRAQLEEAGTYRLGDATLVLSLPQSGGNMTFVRGAAVQPPEATPGAPVVPGMPTTGGRN